jgi:LAO/AO transport system kinase
MELADAILVHKADGENMPLARRTMKEYQQMLHFLQPATPSWISRSLMASSVEKTGLIEMWEVIGQFIQTTNDSGYFAHRRHAQTKEWFHQMIKDHLIDSFYNNPSNKQQVEQLEQQILNGEITVSQGITTVFPNDVKFEG